ncbi:hypothetical protein [Methylorubrum suomiense]|uniref:Uncharacterized protein n=1 Tax=Methylorubrum suomiense TaxID=144191 RepID=A0ABQ4UNW6_9HYPH|nr:MULTISPECIES: hypothetical protein [Methylobacteriaceae]GJE73836.1 hypothetical protein BGCPKDLD_0403 [Methylorubrum suomiense]
MSGAEIPTLPTMGLATGQVSRLVTELAEAQAAGGDLGSEVPALRADHEALLNLYGDLERELAGLQSALDQLGVRGRLAGATLQPLLDEVRHLAKTARCAPERGQDGQA